MTTVYPGALDSFPAVSPSTPMDQSGSEHDLVHNNLADAIVAIETELGTDLAGDYTDLAERLENLGSGGNANIATEEPVSPTTGEFYLDLNSPPPADTYLDQGNAGVAKTVNINDADVQLLTLNSATCAITLTGDPAAGFVRRWELHLEHDATTDARAATWPADVRWPGGTAPTLADTAGIVVRCRFLTRDDGIHFGEIVGTYTP